MKLLYPFLNFYECIENNAKLYPRKIAIFAEDEQVTHKELKQRVDKFAAFLKAQGINEKDKVAFVLGNSVEFIVCLFAITKIGAIAVALNTFLKNEELEYILNDAKAVFLISSYAYQKETRNLDKITTIEQILWCGKAENGDENDLLYDDIMKLKYEDFQDDRVKSLDDLACIIYTSGTTGKPKGAMLSYKNMFSNVVAGNLIFNITQKDRFVVYLPMFHAFTLTIMVLLPLYSSSSIVSIKSVFPFSNVLKQTLLKRVTIFLGVPTVYNAMLKAKIPWYFMWFNKIRLFISGSAPLSEKTLTDFQKKFKKAVLLEGYGLSECSPAVAINRQEKQKPLSIGLALPSYEIKIVNDEMLEVPHGEVGEIIVKGDCVMQGYYNRQDATDETIVNGWVLTGDLGKMDDEGFIYIVDRKKDLIISKGINIYPREIEEVLYMHEDIDATAVIGIKDETGDEDAVAFVKLKDEATPLSEVDYKKFLKIHLANYKIPKQIYIVEELPRNATGKVLKRVLKEKVQNGFFSQIKHKE